MSDGASDNLSYNLYTSTNYTSVAGDGSGLTSTLSGTGSGATQSLNAYGQIPGRNSWRQATTATA